MQAVAALRQQLQWGISCASAAAAYASIAATVKSQAVDRSTIQLWNFLTKGQST